MFLECAYLILEYTPDKVSFLQFFSTHLESCVEFTVSHRLAGQPRVAWEKTQPHFAGSSR